MDTPDDINEEAPPSSAENAASPARVALWVVTAILAGAVIMCLELLAFRLYAPYIGYSIYVWGTMISAVMVALAIGYPLGGKVADLSGGDRMLYLFLLASGAYQLVMLFVAHPLLRSLTQLGEFTSTTVATLIIMVPSLTALATVSPYVIRLLARSGHVGTTAGQVFAISTMGSVAGTLLTSFYLLPAFGTHTTMAVACTVTLLLAVAGLASRKPPLAVLAVPLFAIPMAIQNPWSDSTIFARDSVYNLVRVTEEEGYRRLILNSDRVFQSIQQIGQEGWRTYMVFDAFAIAPLLVEGNNALMLGMGAGSAIGTMQAADPELHFDAVEIDPVVVVAAKEFFGVQAGDKLRIHVADARPWLEKSQDRYDIVVVDLYHGGPYPPFYLTTVEFFTQVREHLTEDGLLMLNILDFGSRKELLYATLATLDQVFESVVSMQAGPNRMAFAFNRKTSLEDFRKRCEDSPATGEFRTLVDFAAANAEVLTAPEGTRPLTDDHAPVEGMVRRALAESARDDAGP